MGLKARDVHEFFKHKKSPAVPRLSTTSSTNFTLLFPSQPFTSGLMESASRCEILLPICHIAVADLIQQ